MKIKNGMMINFLNAAEKLITKKLPTNMYYALSCNFKTLGGFVEPYNQAYEKVKDNAKELNELLNQEIEVSIQTLPKSILDTLDSGEKFDVLTWDEYNAISFMIEG